MTLGEVLDLVSSVGLIIGLVFAGSEWRRARRESVRQAQILLLRSWESRDYVRAMRLILALPDGLSRAEVEERIGPDIDLVWLWLGAMESLGLFVFERVVDIRDVDAAFGGPIIVTFRRLRGFIDEIRTERGRSTPWEWFQWLAEHVEQLEHDEGRFPAHIRERDWRP